MSFKEFEILVINLDKDIEKRNTFKKEFEKIIPKFKFINAVNGKSLSAFEYFLHVKKSKGRASKKLITPSELGCFLSHKSAINSFLKSPKKYLLILEDDVFTKKTLTPLNQLLLDEDRVYILGGQNGMQRPRIFTPFLKSDTPIKIPKIFNSFIYRTCCYAINKNVARKIAKIYEENVFLADDWGSIIKYSKIDGISYIDIFEHPLDLKNSNIEHERLM